MAKFLMHKCVERPKPPHITEQLTGRFTATLCVSVLSAYSEQKQHAMLVYPANSLTDSDHFKRNDNALSDKLKHLDVLFYTLFPVEICLRSHQRLVEFVKSHTTK